MLNVKYEISKKGVLQETNQRYEALIRDIQFTYSFTGNIFTNYAGFQQIGEFHRAVLPLKNQTVELCFRETQWLDANLCAALWATLHQLELNNNLSFVIHTESSQREHLGIGKNGFVACVHAQAYHSFLSHEENIPNARFRQDDVDALVHYIENRFLGHSNINFITDVDKDTIKKHYYEIYGNVDSHANSEKPVFACGHFDNDQKTLMLTMADLGVGILHNVKQYTAGKISQPYEAIKWALKEHTTTKAGKEVGGFGLFNLFKYCLESDHCFQIVSDGYFLEVDGEKITHKALDSDFYGTIINMKFRF